MIISPLTWFLVIYLSVGFYLLIPAIVFAWEHYVVEQWIKVVGSVIAVLVWPIMFMIT